MDFRGMVGDVSFSTGSVQTVRQIRKVVVNETDVTTRRSAIDRESLHPRAPSSNGSEFSMVMRERERERERNTILEEQQRARDTPPPLPARTRIHSRHTEATRPGTMTVDTQTSVFTDEDVQLRHPPSSSSTTSSRSASAAVQCGTTFSCCCGEQHAHGPSAHLAAGAQCSCCPFGYHISVDFAEFAATNKPNGQPARFSTQLDSIKRRSEQLARTRDFLNEHDSLRARVALASAKVPPSPSSDELALAASNNQSTLAREIGSALDVTIDQFATNGHAPVHHQAHAHNALDCPICARRVPIVVESERPDDATSSSKFSVSRRSQQTADEVFEEPASTGHFEIVERYEIIPRVQVEEQRETEQTYDTDVESQSTRRSLPPHQCDHSACEARCASLESQLMQLQEALRIAEQEKHITETKLTILTKQYAEAMMTTRMRIDRAVSTDDSLHRTTCRDTQTDAPSPSSPAVQLNTPRNVAPRRTVGVGDADVHDLSAFVVTCERCEEYRRRPRRHVDLQTETSVRNVATYYRPPTRDVGIGYALDDSPLRPATRECDAQTDACELESEQQIQMEFTSESVSEFIRTFTSSVETTSLNSTSMLRLLRAITAHMSTTEFHALFRAAFRRDVRSVELQASPRCYSVAAAVDRTDFEKEVACGEDYHRLEIPRLSSSFAVQCQPSYHHKYIWTESPITFDVGSVTSDVDVRNRATQTYAALTVATAAQTDRSVSTASYKCEVALSSCPNVPKRDTDSAAMDESYTFDEHEHVTVVVNGVVETRCVREIRSLSSSTHSHNDQLIAASYRTCLSSATETPAENERDEAFVSRPSVAHQLVVAGVPIPVPIPRNRSPSDSDSDAEHVHEQSRYDSWRSTTQTQSSDVFTSTTSTFVMHSSAQDAQQDDSDELAMAAPNGSPLTMKKSILKKGSKSATPVETPISSPTRPKRSITFATQTLVVGSSESSSGGDGDSADEGDSMRAVVYTDQIRETQLVDSIEVADGPILSVAYTSHFEQDELAEDEMEDEETCTSLRKNTTLNSYSAYTDLSEINDTSGQNARDKLSGSPPKFQLPSEVRNACETVESWLEEPDRVDLKEQIDSCMKVIAADWFRLLTEPNRDTVELLEDYLRALNDDYSSDLVERVVQLTDTVGNTALHYALWKQQFDVVDLLLSTDACECNALNLAGYSPIMLAAECKPRSPEHRDVLRRIFEDGDVNQRSRSSSNQQDAASLDSELDGPPALFVAAAHGEPDVVRLMLECGANPNAKDKCGSTALHCAAEHGHPDSVNALVSAGADVNAMDADGSTPLHCAAERGDVQVMRFLLSDPRCDVLIRDQSGRTPLDVATAQEQWDIVAVLEAGREL